jgi:AcrR family transcriptional regulator
MKKKQKKMQESKYQKTARRMDEALLELLYRKDYEYITIKEICKKAEVNRSTFYLHYENMDDLLLECLTLKYDEFFSSFDLSGQKEITSASIEDLNYIKPEYLRPFLEFVKKNSILFRLSISRPKLMKIDIAINEIVKNCIYPVLDRLNVNENSRKYIISYYLNGLAGIVNVWIKNDCKDDIEMIIQFIMNLVSAEILLKNHE